MMPALTSSDGRTKLCAPRLDLITAFLDHESTSPRVHESTTRVSQDTAAQHDGRRRAGSRPTQLVRHHHCPSVSLPSASDPESTAVVLILKAQHAARWRHTEKPPSRYRDYGSHDMSDVHVCGAPSLEGLFRMHTGAACSPRGHFALGMQASLPGRLGRRTGQPRRQAWAFSGGRTATDGTGPGLASTLLPPPPS